MNSPQVTCKLLGQHSWVPRYSVPESRRGVLVQVLCERCWILSPLEKFAWDTHAKKVVENPPEWRLVYARTGGP